MEKFCRSVRLIEGFRPGWPRRPAVVPDWRTPRRRAAFSSRRAGWMRRFGALLRRPAWADRWTRAQAIVAPGPCWGRAPAEAQGRWTPQQTPVGRRRRKRPAGAGVGSDDIDGLVAAERAEWIAKRLVGARTNFAVALQRRRRIDARPWRRRAADLVKTGAGIAEQFLLRHCRIWLCRVLGRLRRLRRRRG